MLTRKEFLRQSTALAVAGTLPGGLVAGTPAKRPNILFVIVDEWRAQAFGALGDRNAHTPALDRFRRQSVSFDNAVACLPVCSQSRASFLTGQYPLTNGVYITDVPLKPSGETLAEALVKAGYQTGYIGKWHLYGSPKGRYERRLSYIPPESRFGFQYWKALECGHDYNKSRYYEGDDPTPRYWPGYDAIAQTQDAVGYIQRASQTDQPFFLTLSLGPPHFPYTAPERYKAMYRDRPLDFRPNVPEALHGQAAEEMRGYYAAIAALDDCFATLMAGLEASGVADDTIVLFTADHGDMLWSQGLQHKHVPWDEAIRVPFMIRYPRQSRGRGRSVPAPLNSPDVMPTLLGLAGLPAPSGVQGLDYSPLIRREPMAAMPRSAYLAIPVSFADARAHGFAEYRGVRTERYTYIRSIKGPWLLYDNRKDPYQKHNLVDQPAMAEVQKACEAQLTLWLDRLGDQFLPGDAYLRRDGLGHYLEVQGGIKPVVSPWGDWRSTM
ncbi:sulfatase family protein [Sphingobium sp. CAP-1]|uniref:sulfatase family protein n=1 Tax=Sphingobium sp. CAP-1 TaxID=2676077 RepID=UPI0018AD1ABA|nr:sulfatase [Sphingobium sp. CAP-1]